VKDLKSLSKNRREKKRKTEKRKKGLKQQTSKTYYTNTNAERVKREKECGSYTNTDALALVVQESGENIKYSVKIFK